MLYATSAEIKNRHPCFTDDVSIKKGRLHLPVSPVCNIRCKFCKRNFNKTEQRPGVASKLVSPQEAVYIVDKALGLCPDITVVGIAGPGDTLASGHAIETFEGIHERYPHLINCLSTNGLLLDRYAYDLWDAGVKTVTVTVNAVDAGILNDICSYVFYDGKSYEGVESAEILIEAQKCGIARMAALGAVVKINTVLIPGINDFHIKEIAYLANSLGASIMNIIPLIPQHEMAGNRPPSCAELDKARTAVEEYLPVFRHCQHCRADACGIPGINDLSELLYEYKSCETAQTFSHG